MASPLDDYTLPDDALCRSQNGWGKQLYRVTVVIQQGDMPQFLDRVWQQEGGLLGEGELVFITDQPEGEQAPTGRSYRGYLVFQPTADPEPSSIPNKA
jgi:hypothetical protein